MALAWHARIAGCVRVTLGETVAPRIASQREPEATQDSAASRAEESSRPAAQASQVAC